MRFLILVIVVFFVLVYLYYVHVSTELDNIDYKFDLRSVDFSKFNIKDVVGDGAKIKSEIGIDLKNNSNLKLSFKDLYLELYYNDVLVARSSDDVNNFSRITISKHSDIYIKQSFDIFLNKSALAMIADVRKGKSVIGYKVKLNWFGLKVSHSGSYKYQ